MADISFESLCVRSNCAFVDREGLISVVWEMTEL